VSSKRKIAIIGAVLSSLVAAGCSGGQSDLQKWIEATKKKPGGRIQPLPEVKPYESFVYSATSMRSPFQPLGASAANGQNLRPSSRRNREFLEGFSLDTLKMVGTLNLGGSHYGLVSTKDGRVHRVVVGEHIGTNDGKITDITPSKIALVEIIPDGLGGYIERPAALGLNE
jgi:type IV pilus assembly protein PilP